MHNHDCELTSKADDPIKRIGSFLKGKRGVRKKAKIGLSDFFKNSFLRGLRPTTDSEAIVSRFVVRTSSRPTDKVKVKQTLDLINDHQVTRNAVLTKETRFTVVILRSKHLPDANHKYFDVLFLGRRGGV